MKLRLDAAVIQSGRLAQSHKKTSKAEMQAAIRYGADTVFKSAGSTITDADIDAIISRGEQKTDELSNKLKDHAKGDLMDFKLDYSSSLQEFDGEDFSEETKRKMLAAAEAEEQLRLLESMTGKRERKKVTYNEAEYHKNLRDEAAAAAAPRSRKVKQPKVLRLPRMDEWQFWESGRLTQLHEAEKRAYQARVSTGGWGVDGALDASVPLLEPELNEEKERLLANPFANIRRSDMRAFVDAASRFGRDEPDKIAADVARKTGVKVDVLRRYADVFWVKGPTHLSKEWDRIDKQVAKGEEKLQWIIRLESEVRDKVSRFDQPLGQLDFLPNYLQVCVCARFRCESL